MLQGASIVFFVQPAAGAELLFLTEKLASAGQHTLAVSSVPFLDYGFETRGYNGGIPGPTFRMKPGETLKVKVQNDLSNSNNVACAHTAGEFCETATTNLHTHGLHVSSKGMEDGLAYYSDDIFADIQPGESAEFQFAIPDSHMGGTHWYHPHHHHATALQAGGGLAGVLIVEDPAGYLPSEYSSMPDKILFISGHNLVTMQRMARSAQSTLWTSAVNDANAASLDTNAFVVNGERGPTLSLQSHTWHRLRMVYAAVEQGLHLSVSGDATCQMNLLAKDGIYLNKMPRAITTVVLFPGARADVAMSCTCAIYPCTGVLGSSGARRLQRFGGGGGGPGMAGGNMAAVDLLQLIISEGPSSTVVPLPETSVRRPCYLVDLRSATVPAANSNSLNLNGPNRVVQFNGQGTSMTYANTHAGGNTMSDWPALATYTVGSVYELVVQGVNRHPLHIHVSPFQITSMPANSYFDGYFEVGDWHDTLMISTLGGRVTVRQQTDKFTGKMVIHCHILEHEDEGMMAFISVTGTEGTTYSDTSTLDATCYTNHFVSDGPTLSPTPTPPGIPTPAPTLAENTTASTGPLSNAAMGRSSSIFVLFLAAPLGFFQRM